MTTRMGIRINLSQAAEMFSPWQAAAATAASGAMSRAASAAISPSEIVMMDALDLPALFALDKCPVSNDDGLSRPHRKVQSEGERHRRPAGPRCLADQAAERDAQVARGGGIMGPLHGLPHAVKDLRRSRASARPGSPILKDFVPTPIASGGAHAQGRRHLHRQDQHPGIRPGLAHLQSGLWRDP